jgi:hypothetical protein
MISGLIQKAIQSYSLAQANRFWVNRIIRRILTADYADDKDQTADAIAFRMYPRPSEKSVVKDLNCVPDAAR